MDSIDLKGPNLKKKQEQYNNLVKQTIKNKTPFETVEQIKVASDIDSLFKIDIASEYQNVDYILKILQSDDMLLISRAIKRSTWLINGEEYVHIINPTYLEKALFPNMMPKAMCKFMLNIRLKLNDEKRADEFFNHYEEADIEKAMKWLPKCSLQKILEAIKIHYAHIDEHLFKKLCERSDAVFEAFYSNSQNKNKYFTDYFSNHVKFLLRSNPKLFIDIYEKFGTNGRLKLGPRTTRVVLKYDLDHFINNFDKYLNTLHMPTFAKFLGKEKIMDFITKQMKNDKYDNIRSWFQRGNLKPFLKEIPRSQEKFDFVSKIFTEKSGPTPMLYRGAMACPMKISGKTSSIYKFYRHAPFNFAFPELQKLIRTESSMDERSEMLSEMLICAGRNNDNIKSVLKYFVEKHMNEASKLKLKFAYNVVDNTQIQQYDEEMWEILQQVFYSLEVYNTATNSNVTKFAEAIAMYLVLRDETVPEVIEKRIDCSFLKDFKLDGHQKAKAFEYIYQLFLKKLENVNIAENTNYSESAKAVGDVLRVLKYWKKDLSDYPIVMEKAKMLLRIRNKVNLSHSIGWIIEGQKSWRKYFFEESLMLWPTEESCLNAVKHDPDLFTRNNAVVNEIKEQGEAHALLLRKLRIYWYNTTLYNDWLTAYRNRLEKHGEQNASIRGMFQLVPREELITMIKHNVPKEDKIKWSEVEEIQLGKQKGIAKYMPLIRPQIPFECVLLYLKGDYIQFANASYAALLYNQPSKIFRCHLDALLEHGNKNVEKQSLRAAFAKLDSAELTDTFLTIWKRAKNISIRAVIFHLTYKMMCDSKNPERAKRIWNLLKIFIDELYTDKAENSSIYEILTHVELVPKYLQPEFLKRSYEYFKSLRLPDVSKYDSEKDQLVLDTVDMMDSMDADFMKDIIQDYLRDFFEKVSTREPKDIYDAQSMMNVIVSFILCVQKEETQIERYASIFLPILRQVREHWNVIIRDKVYYCRTYFKMFLKSISQSTRKYISTGKGIVPAKLYSYIESKLITGFQNPEDFTMTTNWSIATEFIKRLEKTVAGTPKEIDIDNDSEDDDDNTKYWDKLITSMTQDVADIITKTTEEHLNSFFPSVTILLPDIINDFFKDFKLAVIEADLLKLILQNNLDKAHICIMIIELVFHCYKTDENKTIIREIHEILSKHPSVEVRMHYFVKYEAPQFD